MIFVLGNGGSATTGQRLKGGGGGQGTVYELAAPNGHLALKRYHDQVISDTPDLGDRLQAMVQSVPPCVFDEDDRCVLAWPSDLAYLGDQVVGFVMPLLDTTQTTQLHQLANPTSRSRGFDWRYLVTTAKNLAFVISRLHDSEVIVGDLSDTNVLVHSDTRITIIDCDSMQVVDPVTGRYYFCVVGREEFLPPELHGLDLSATVRRRSSDLYSLAVLLHLLLLGGEHPFRGKWLGSGESPTLPELARRGVWAHSGNPEMRPRKWAVPADFLPASTRELFHRALVDGADSPRSRPTAAEWHEDLSSLSAGLRTCRSEKGHVYPRDTRDCPWCDQQFIRFRQVSPNPSAAEPESSPAGEASPSNPSAAGTPAPTTAPPPTARPPSPRPTRPAAPTPSGSPATPGLGASARRVVAVVLAVALLGAGAVMALDSSGGDDEAELDDSGPDAPSTVAVSGSNPTVKGSASSDGSCYLAQLATFETEAVATGLADDLNAATESTEVRIGPSAWIPGWSPGRFVVFGAFPSEEAATDFLGEARAFGYSGLLVPLPSGAAACG